MKPIALAATLVISIVTAFGARAEPITSPDHPALREESTFLEVRGATGNYRLEAYVVRPAANNGRLPIALLTHGKPRLPTDLVKIRGELMSRQARDLAYRGYLAVAVVRRGFGRSDGTPGRPANAAYARCSEADLRRYFDVESEDLERALQAIASRPDADGTRAIAIGHSVGGGAILALAARNPPGLKAVVNLAGATRITDAGSNLACPQDVPIAALASFGRDAKIPSLWVCAENDSNFGPDAARKLHASFTAQGGNATLRIAPSLQPDDGHNVFELTAGRQRWLAALDPFLRERGLPTWRPQQVDALMQRYNLAPGRRPFVESYFSLLTPKVLVRSSTGVLNYSAATSGLEAAQKAAAEGCEKAARAPCAAIMTNFDIATGN
jgi:dienelactone hydrolase